MATRMLAGRADIEQPQTDEKAGLLRGAQKNIGLRGVLREYFQEYSLAHWGSLLLVPWMLFTLVMLPFGLWYQVVPWVAWLVFVTGLLLCSLCVFAGLRPHSGPRLFLFLMAASCSMAIILGMLLGFYCHFAWVRTYVVYKNSESYNRISPSDVPGPALDAGSISFTNDAFLDDSKSVGFKDDKTYCAAPILSKAALMNTAAFWAVGEDCCEARGKFNCGISPARIINGGLVVIEGGWFAPPVRPYYMLAAKQAAATYHLTLPEEVTFLQWTEDYLQYWWQAVRCYCLCVFIYLGIILTLLIGIAIPRFVRRSLKAQASVAA